MSLRRDLVLVLEEGEKDENIEDDAELEQKLHTFRVSITIGKGEKMFSLASLYYSKQ